MTATSEGPRSAPYVGVIGTSQPGPQLLTAAAGIGEAIAQRGGVLLCGGLGGVMEAAARGARAAGGTTVGILPRGRDEANPWLDVALATGLGEMRNLVLVRSCDVVIAVGGGYGTLSEIAFALRVGTPVVGFETWELAAPPETLHVGRRRQRDLETADSPAAAVQRAWELMEGR